MVASAVPRANSRTERLATEQKRRRLAREANDAQKAIELESKRFAKEMTIQIRKQNMDVIQKSTTRLLHSVFDKHRFEKRKRRQITKDSKSIQRQIVANELENMAA